VKKKSSRSTRASNSSCTNEALAILTEAKKQMGGEAALILSLTDSATSDADVNEMVIQHDKDNAYVEVRVFHEDVNKALKFERFGV
jgi:hypothetical protein